MTRVAAHMLLAGDVLESFDGLMTVRSIVEDLNHERITVYATDSKKAPRTFEYGSWDSVSIV